MIRILCVAALTACMPMAPALAQPAVPAATDLVVVPCRTHDVEREKADAALRDQAFGLMQAHNLAALTKLLPDLQAALDRAPNVAPAIEQCGDKLNIYSRNLADYTVVTTTVMAQKRPGVTGTVMFMPLPYARIAWEIGWIYYEQHNLTKAIAAFEKGLPNDPQDTVLAGEYANALEQDGQNAKALAFIDSFIAANPNLSDGEHAVMLRRRGYALGELGHYDDAIAAYKESLKYVPNNAMALNEITYNTQQKALHAK